MSATEIIFKFQCCYELNFLCKCRNHNKIVEKIQAKKTIDGAESCLNLRDVRMLPDFIQIPISRRCVYNGDLTHGVPKVNADPTFVRLE